MLSDMMMGSLNSGSITKLEQNNHKCPDRCQSVSINNNDDDHTCTIEAWQV